MSAGIDLRYRLTSWGYWQTSVSYRDISYTNSEFGSNRGFDLTSGVNLSFLGTNALALRLDQPTLIKEAAGYGLAGGQESSEMFGIVGVRARYSRPLGERTGLNLSVGNRRLLVDNDYAVLGYSIDYLSPWSNLWEGTSVSGGLKHFFPRQITTEVAVAYYDKNFANVFEYDNTLGEPCWRDLRKDQLTTLSLKISKSISIPNGSQITPSINLGYRKNNSTSEFYTYEDFLASFALRVGL